ncbi:MAG: acyl transferase [Bacteroidetes bacterium]|nr:acyl transferase [Bacteroidota bacterium]
MNPSDIFSIKSKREFERRSLEIFRHQAKNNAVYKNYIQQLGIVPEQIKAANQIPFLPIEFFKTHKVETIKIEKKGVRKKLNSQLFLSSGTTGMERSKHFVSDIGLYEKSFRKCFELFYGNVKQYSILAFLPSYYENKNSSLLYMVNDLRNNASPTPIVIEASPLEDTLKQTTEALQKLLSEKKKVILFGVSYALLDFTPTASGLSPLSSGRWEGGEVIIIETGGMKGRREEITREELHKTLCKKFGMRKIHSEYGMTELLSQAYSKGDGIFNCPPWMKVFVRDVNDPFQITNYEFGVMNKKTTTTGAINIIDLANINSCSFIATQDIGKIHQNNSFEVLGRMNNSDLRGCNLLTH